MTAGVAARPRVSRKSSLAAARADVVPAAAAEYEARIEALAAELREAREQQTATAEVLGVINSSPGDLRPVFEAILDKAHSLCGANIGWLLTFDGEFVHTQAMRGLTDLDPALASRPFLPGPAMHELIEGASFVQIPDITDLAEVPRTPLIWRASVKLLGAGTYLVVPLRKDGAVRGFINAFRSPARLFSEKEIALLENFAAQAVIAMENARLLGDLRERTRDLQESLEYQTATSDVLQVISRSAFDLQPVLDTLIETAARLCGAEKAILYRHENGTYRFAAGYSTEPEYERIERVTPIYPGEGTVAGRAALRQRAVQIIDALADPLYEQKEAARVGKARSMIGVPMLRDGSPIGVIALARERVEPFTDRQIELVQTFADQAVIAIENARLIAETREALEQQTATAEVLGVINANPGDLQPVFDAILEKALNLCSASFGVLWTYDGEVSRASASRGATAAYREFLSEPHRPGPGSAQLRLIQGEHLVHVADLADSDDYRSGDALPRALVDLGGGRSMLALPLRKDDAYVGAIMIYRQEVSAFSDAEIAVLQSFAAQAVIAMENARLLGDLRERTCDLQESLEYQTATSDVLKVISRSTFDLQPVLDTLVETAARLCDAQMAFIFRPDGDLYRVSASVGFSPKTKAFVEANPVSPGRGTVAGRTALTGEVVHIPDARLDPEYTWGEFLRVAKTPTMLGVPLLRKAAPVGVIVLARGRVEPFTERQIELVCTFADQAVIAIENMRLITETRAARDTAEKALGELRATQQQLIVQQKMAALGQLTAGIAHEIKNPLNFVNNFAALSVELLGELKEMTEPAVATLDDDARADIGETIGMLTGNLEKIGEHGRRADGIVKSMLAHSRGTSGERERVDLNALVDEALNLAYHGARAQDQNFNITLERDFATDLAPVEMVPQDVTRVFLNLIGNGFHAAHRRLKEAGDESFRPVLKVTTRNLDGAVEVRVRDNGTGIRPEHRDKLFQPFFTTKPTGEGTGLGLSISYDIVTQQHGGTITVDSEVGSFTEFIVRLPRANT